MAALVGVIALAALTGCVGRSGSSDDYRHKVANAAQSMVSSLRRAKLQLMLVRDDKTFAATLRVSLQQADSDAGTIVTQLDSVQPPTPAALRLRDRVDPPLHAASSMLGTLRVLAASGHKAQLLHELTPLTARIAAVQPFEELA